MRKLVDKRATMEPVSWVPAWSSTANSPLPGPAGIHLNFVVSWSKGWGSPHGSPAISYVGGSLATGYELKYAYCPAAALLPATGGPITLFGIGAVTGVVVLIVGVILRRRSYEKK